jgi:hypothetical protein
MACRVNHEKMEAPRLPTALIARGFLCSWERVRERGLFRISGGNSAIVANEQLPADGGYAEVRWVPVDTLSQNSGGAFLLRSSSLGYGLAARCVFD